MGYDLHITKADDWTEASDQPISGDEVKSLLAADPELGQTFSIVERQSFWRESI